MRKKLLSMVMAGTLALSFTACGGSSSGETEKSTDTSKVEETSSGDTQAASADSGNKKTITVWVEKIFSDDANTKMEERLKEYGKEKNVTVNCEMVAATDFVTKLNAAIEAGQSVPDIISADTTKVLNYYPNIPCNDVTDLVDQIDEERPYLQASYEGTKIDDKYYYVPFYSSSTLMFVRKDKLEEAGITEMPTTWDEVFKDAEKVSDPDNDFYGLAIGCGENDDDDENTIRQYMWNEGGYLFDEDGNVAADDKVTAVFDKYAELYDKQTKGGKLTQVDREKSLKILMRINLLKRIESSIDSFRITTNGIVSQIEQTIKALSKDGLEDLISPQFDTESENFDWETNWGDEENVFGKKVKVHLADIDRRQWKEDLEEDLDRKSVV